MRRPTYRKIQRSMIAAAVCAGIGAVLILPHVLTGRSQDAVSITLIVGSWLVAIILLVRVWFDARRLGRGIEGIRTAVLNVVTDREATLPSDLPGGLTPEMEAMLRSLTLYQDEVTRERFGPDRRMVAVLGSLSSGVVVMTEQGQVSLVNNAAGELLGAERVRVGTSLFAALSRSSVMSAVVRAEKAARPVEALIDRLDDVSLQGRVTALPDGEGAVFIFPPMELDRHRPGVQFDLELHDVPPVPTAPALDISLDDLPAVIMDTETTGLDVLTDRVVSIGAVCAHGARLFKSRMIDDLVDPGVAIPPASTVIHGITDDMVAEARQFPEVWADFQRLAKHRVVVGHNVPYDLTILRQECLRHDRPWEDFVFIDTMRLASLLNPTLGKYDLENLAQIYQIDLHGRHTALGDALVTAELFCRLVSRLQMQGIATLGDLLRFHCTQALDIIAVQRHQGWITGQPESLRAQHEELH
jgi:DNA polymerase III subunit epsilon